MCEQSTLSVDLTSLRAQAAMLLAAQESNGNLYLGSDEHGIAVGCRQCGQSYVLPPDAAEARKHKHI